MRIPRFRTRAPAFFISGGITGTTANLVINNDGTTASGITISTASLNNTGTLTNSGTGAGSVLISGGIGSNVTTVAQSMHNVGPDTQRHRYLHRRNQRQQQRHATFYRRHRLPATNVVTLAAAVTGTTGGTGTNLQLNTAAGVSYPATDTLNMGSGRRLPLGSHRRQHLGHYDMGRNDHTDRQ